VLRTQQINVRQATTSTPLVAKPVLTREPTPIKSPVRVRVRRSAPSSPVPAAGMDGESKRSSRGAESEWESEEEETSTSSPSSRPPSVHMEPPSPASSTPRSLSPLPLSPSELLLKSNQVHLFFTFTVFNVTAVPSPCCRAPGLYFYHTDPNMFLSISHFTIIPGQYIHIVKITRYTHDGMSGRFDLTFLAPLSCNQFLRLFDTRVPAKCFPQKRDMAAHLYHYTPCGNMLWCNVIAE